MKEDGDHVRDEEIQHDSILRAEAKLGR